MPIETYLRPTFLKYRYRLAFEPLCRQVADSISWQRFCRIPLLVSVPDLTTLMEITTGCGTAAVEGSNSAVFGVPWQASGISSISARRYSWSPRRSMNQAARA